MKVFGLFVASALAESENWNDVEKRKGKHGRVNLGEDGDRLLLHYPICMNYPDHSDCKAECRKTFTDFSGRIEMKDYESYTSCLWEIKLPATRTIEFKFEGDFDLEYHYQCGYDRVHIFSGAIDGDNQRQARFCGPNGPNSLPWDGSKRNVAGANGQLNFFSAPFDIQNNQAFVGFDADQSFVGGGFTLVWNSHKIYEYDFTNVFEAHEFVITKADYLFSSVLFETAKEKAKYQKRWLWVKEKSQVALQNNPGSSGKKKRRCAKSEQETVSDVTVRSMMKLADNERADFRDAMDSLEDLINEFLGECIMAGKKWPERITEFANAVEQDRTL